jgi:ribosomal protein L44E
MTITIREQILAALRNNPGLNSEDCQHDRHDHQKDFRPVKHIVGRRPDRVRRHGQRLYRLTSYGMKYAPETIPGMPKGNSKLVQRTEANVICQECRNSAVMKEF